MKIPLIVFGIIVTMLAVMIFGSIALSRFVRWLGWPQDALAAIGVLFVLLAGLSLAAWRIGEMDDRQERRIKNRSVVSEREL